uniref:Uncharacterized protein n=1 Tax=Cannabis sativa TaxID=3483 RepID=A0A803NZA8_CANSA
MEAIMEPEDSALTEADSELEDNKDQIEVPEGFGQTVQQTEIEESRNYEEEILGGNKSKWLQAMDEEMDSFRTNKTCVVVPNPENKKIVECK